MRPLIWIQLLFIWTLSCSGKPGSPHIPVLEPWEFFMPKENGEDPAVAWVDEVPIPVSRVARRAGQLSISPEEALEQLIDEQLVLADALATKGPHLSSDALKAAAIFRLLSTRFEPDHTPEQIPDETLRELYQEIQRPGFSEGTIARQKFIFNHGEWRAADQLVITSDNMPDPESGSTMESALLLLRDHYELTGDKNRDSFRNTAWVLHHSYIPVRFEQLPPLSRDEDENFYRFGGEFDEGWIRELFAIPRTGDLSGIFSTPFGIHWVFLAAVIPETRRTFEEVREELREAIGDSHRSMKFSEWIGELRKQHGMQWYVGKRN